MTTTASSQAAPISQRQAQRPELPLENLSLEETLRVMDVAREMRDQRQSAEEMFRRDDLRAGLRDKLVRQARLSGDPVTDAEIDAAISRYLERLHVYKEPAAGFKRVLAHAWVQRGKLLLASAAVMVAAGGLWWLLS
ncbi:MAG: DUF6384 family protein [Planctomycetota bacterium]